MSEAALATADQVRGLEAIDATLAMSGDTEAFASAQRVLRTVLATPELQNIGDDVRALMLISRGARVGMGTLESLEVYSTALHAGIKVQDADTAIVFGRSMGLTPKESIFGVQLVTIGGKTKPQLGAHEAGALIRQRFGAEAWQIAEHSPEVCDIRVRQTNAETGEFEFHHVRFTQEDAKRAGLAGKDMWRKWPPDMLFARCIARVQKRYFSHLGGGEIYIAELVEQSDAPKAQPQTLADLGGE